MRRERSFRKSVKDSLDASIRAGISMARRRQGIWSVYERLLNHVQSRTRLLKPSGRPGDDRTRQNAALYTMAMQHAEDAGLAFQLTNILRDLGEDAARGRVYLPQEDLDRFGYDADRLERGLRDDAFRALMQFQVQRAHGFYDAGWRLVPLLAPAGRAVFLMMARTYRGLLDEIERRDYDVFSSRVRLSRWKKVRLAVGVLPVRLGWM